MAQLMHVASSIARFLFSFLHSYLRVGSRYNESSNFGSCLWYYLTDQKKIPQLHKTKQLLYLDTRSIRAIIKSKYFFDYLLEIKVERDVPHIPIMSLIYLSLSISHFNIYPIQFIPDSHKDYNQIFY